MALFTVEASPGQIIPTSPERIGRQMEVLTALDPKVKAIGDKWFKDPNELWQPHQLLPDPKSEAFHEELAAFRQRTAGLSKGCLVALVGNGVTEEGLFLFTNRLMAIDAARDEDGMSQGGFAINLRRWGGEEDRHKRGFGIVIYLSGMVNMSAYDKTIHHYLRNGFNPRLVAPYDGVFYPYEQELAAVISHHNTGEMAEAQGATDVATLCYETGNDETRHAGYYGQVSVDVVKKDPEEAVITLAERVHRTVVMPGARMSDEGDLPPDVEESDLFSKYAAVAQRLGIYGASDYYAIVRANVRKFGIEKLALSGAAAEAQAFLCTMFTEQRAERLNTILTRRAERDYPNPAFSWIYDEPVFSPRAA